MSLDRTYSNQLAAAMEEAQRRSVALRTCECGKVMNPAERMLGPVCGKCVRRKHQEATS